jgi:hypothetical protein
MYANTEIAADREQWGRRSAEKIWQRCVISAADHPLRQQPRPRACVCLTGRLHAATATDTSVWKIRKVVKNSSRQQFLGF